MWRKIVAATGEKLKTVGRSRRQTAESRLLCATSVFSVTLWWITLGKHSPQRHRGHRGCTETSVPLASAYCLLPTAYCLLRTQVSPIKPVLPLEGTIMKKTLAILSLAGLALVAASTF